MKKILLLISPILFFISLIFPKNKRIWLYGAWFGQRYSDNSKDFFEYSNKIESNNIKHYWIYKDQKLKSKIESKGYQCIYAYSFQGILIQLRAKVFITCINSSDFVPFLITPRNYFIQLWHGSPIKHIGVDSRKSAIRKFFDIIRFKTIDNYSLIVSPSAIFDDIYKRAFYSNGDKILRSGYPRNKNLVIDKRVKKAIRSYFKVTEEEKLVAYLPTHRNEGKKKNPFIPVLNDLIKNDKVLKDKKIKVIIKPHFYEKDSLKKAKETENILIKYELPFDLYEFLGATDVLITDYSSVMFDYELLNKKILVYAFDLDKYKATDRNLYFDFSYLYENVLNVEKVDSIDHLCKSLSDNIKEPSKKSSIFNTPLGSYSKTIYNKTIKDLDITN